ncbi:MAG: serine/threonine-protein kinase [Myxococcota bacterium]
MSQTAPPSPSPGTVIGGYEVVDRIAVGGMAEVFRAHQVPTERLVVLKRMLPAVAAEPDGPAMFEEEARLGAHVRHPNVVELLEHFTDGGQPFLAFEYVPGCDLWQLTRWLLRNGQKMEVQIALFITRQLLSGLQAVHDATDEGGQPLDIIHQDVSPSNVLLSIHGDVKLGDFGIARSKMRNAPANASTRSKGKLGYLAPEQVTGGATGRRTDVFAAGVICAELLMGRPLFSGGSELAILLAIRDANIRPFMELDLPADLKKVISRALARDPDERLPSSRSFANVLGRFIQRSRSELRAQVGVLVERASGSLTPPEKKPRPATPVPEAPPVPEAAKPVPIFEAVTPVPSSPPSPARASAAPTVRPPEPIDPEGFEDADTGEMIGAATPITTDLPQQKYRIRTAGGETKEYSFAELVEAITTGRVGSEDHVSIDGSPLELVREHVVLGRYLPMSTQTPITQDARVAQEPDIRRNLAASGIVRALAESAVRRDIGLWLCEHGGVRKEIYIKDGKPEYVGSNLAGEMLGEFLVSRKIISRGELDMALAVLPRFEGRLGDTLVGLGLVQSIHLFQHIATQVSEKLFDLFTWKAGTMEFYRGVAPPPSGFPLDLNPWAILDEGIDRRLQAGLEEARFSQHLTSSVQRVRQFPSYVEEGELSPSVLHLLEIAAEPIPLADVVDAFDDGEDFRRGYRVVLVALQLDVVRWV